MINLLPPKRLVNMRLARSNTILSRYIKLLVASIILLGGIIGAAYHFLNVQQQNAIETNQFDQERISALQPYHEQAKQLSATINTISSVLSQELAFSNMLTQIGNLMPTGAALTGLELSAEDLSAPLVVSAHVDTEQRAAVLLNNLNQDNSLFERAQIRNIKLIESESESESAGPYRYVVTLDVYIQKQAEEKQ